MGDDKKTSYMDLIPLVSQLLLLGLSIAEMIERADDISDDDKEAMRAAIIKAKESVTEWK